MKSITPYLKALKAFEAAARYSSFSQAADELFVTSAAVGQLVRNLEEQLGTELFHRNQSGQARLTLTETAAAALPDIQAGFDLLNRGFKRLQQAKNPCVLTVTTSPAFAAKWLLPRLEHFQNRHPDITVRLHTDSKSLDFALLDIDLGVRYGKGSWDGLTSELLMKEEVFPVCSPQWLATHPVSQVEDLLQATLIYDLSMESGQGFVPWQQWFERADVSAFMLKPMLQINNSAAVLQATIEGQGIALARSQMAKDDLACGRLVRLFPEISYPAPLAYYVVYQLQDGEKAKVAAFKEWLKTEAE
ncbi:transcriptional regulator GcvA [Pasteurellaceae bacterium LIM206]|nr:transcriptional regulator GcvA [Pasteurellaceae bacterium LIM206]